MKRVLLAAAYLAAGTLSAGIAAGLATLLLDDPRPAPPVAVSQAKLDAQASQVAYRYLAALSAHDWPAACTLVRRQGRCLEALVREPPVLYSFGVVAASSARGHAVASGTMNDVPVRILLVRQENTWLIEGVELSSDASEAPTPADSTAPGA
jgi:hypothetical protein